MKGFIKVTRLHNGAALPILIAIHTIGTVKPKYLGPGQSSEITLSFGSSGKEEYALNESYDDVLALIEQAQSEADAKPSALGKGGTTW